MSAPSRSRIGMHTSSHTIFLQALAGSPGLTYSQPVSSPIGMSRAGSLKSPNLQGGPRRGKVTSGEAYSHAFDAGENRSPALPRYLFNEIEEGSERLLPNVEASVFHHCALIEAWKLTCLRGMFFAPRECTCASRTTDGKVKTMILRSPSSNDRCQHESIRFGTYTSRTELQVS